MSEKEVIEQPNDPLHGITLKMILEQLVDYYSWEELDEMLEMDCFYKNPTMKSSLKFLRNPKFKWAREKVEKLYLETDFGNYFD
ncbi:MAG: VF530 family DNA-binding protein [Lentisphaeraceae bacterium]|nr:VF530 family DNA-binding protein [Lentisphaeraceae bacterium]